MNASDGEVTMEELDEINLKVEQITRIIESVDHKRTHLLWEAIWDKWCKECGRRLEDGRSCYCSPSWDD